MNFQWINHFARTATLASLIFFAAAGAPAVQAAPMSGLNLSASLLRDLRSAPTETQVEKAYYYRRYYHRRYRPYYRRRYYRPYYYRPYYYRPRYYHRYYWHPWRRYW